MQNLEQSIIRILNAQKRTVGTGFLVSDQLAVTCAHVVQAAGSDCGQPVHIRTYRSSDSECISTAHVLAVEWSPRESDDVAFLQLDEMLEGMVSVVLGSAGRCEGHPYFTLGFASLAGYEVRKVNDSIEGVIPVQDRCKRSMLQIKGEEIDKGLSGAPVLDKQTNRVVGMISEYKDNDQTRFAWATTVDTLIALNRSLHLWPDAYGPEELDLYLQHLIRTNQWLKLPNGRDVLLERVYVSLRADEMNARERKAENELYLKDVAIFKKAAKATVTDGYAEFSAIRKAIARRPTMFMLDARNWVRHFREHEQGSLNLAEVVQRHAYVVILGDPGSGKTTLGKWLALQFARALHQKEDHVLVRADMVRPGIAAERMLDLGSPWLPIFLSIADYARARWERRQDSGLTLEEFLGSAEHMDRLPTGLTREATGALIRDFLRQGQLLVILDGLDEVSNPTRRKKVVEAVRRFIHKLSSELETVDQPSSPEHPEASEQRGNRVVLTSRIVGYQFDPLIDLPHYTVEEMDDTSITAFCYAWMRYVATPTVSNPSEVDRLAEQLKEAIFSYAHPGIRSMAGNPLLLTIIVQVYWSNRSHDGSRTLPSRRVALFDQALQALYDQREAFWDQAGITLSSLSRAFGVVAAAIHGSETAGFITEGAVRKCLRTALSNDEQVEVVLSAARDVSGFLIARGEGIYGFLHRAVQEYFAAQHLVSKSEQILENLVAHALNPAWNEPVVLAIGIVSRPRHPEHSRLPELFAALLDTPDSARDFLPRRELLAIAACLECESIPQGVGRRIAANLLSYYPERNGRSRSELLLKRIQQIFVTFQHGPEVMQREVEELLCTEIRNDDFERRYTAIDLTIETKWDSPAIAEALVYAWRTYAAPAGSLLMALEDIYERRPDCFQATFLPVKGFMKMKPQLWERAKENREWRNMLRILYLPRNADFEPEQMNRDSPLTEQVIMVLAQEASDSHRLAVFRRQLVSLAKQPYTPEARDAVLLLSAMGDTSWIETYLSHIDTYRNHTDNQKYLAYSIIASLAFFANDFAEDPNYDITSDRTYTSIKQARVLAQACKNASTGNRPTEAARNLANTLTHLNDVAHGIVLTRTYADTRIRARALDRAHSRYIVSTRTLSRELVFTNAINHLHEIEQYIQSASQHWSKNASLEKRFNLALVSIQALIQFVDALDPVTNVWAALVDAYLRVWPSRSIREKREGVPRPLRMTQEVLETLIADLASHDDVRRDSARRELNAERRASIMGEQMIENIATFAYSFVADVHDTLNSQIGTQLESALHHIIYDKPDWISNWIDEAYMAKEDCLATRILSNIRRVTPTTFDVLSQAIPTRIPVINIALLISLKWVVHLNKIPQRRLSSLLQRLWNWFTHERDGSIRSTILEVLGSFQEEELALEVGKLLLNNIPNEQRDTALYWALGHLMARQSELIEPFLTSLFNGSFQVGIAAPSYKSRAEEQSTFEKQLFSDDKEWRRQLQLAGQNYGDLILTIDLSSQINPVALFERYLNTSLDDAWLDYDEDSRRYLQSIKQLIRDRIPMQVMKSTFPPISPVALFTRMLAMGVDDDWWDDTLGIHYILVTGALRYVEHSRDSLVPELLRLLLDQLQLATEKTYHWPARRLLLAIVAACAEVMPTVLQQVAQGRLETLLVKCAADTESFTSRRFALTALGYLRTVTSNVASALIAGCQDIEEVQQYAIAAAGHFQSIEGDLLPQFIPALTGESVSTAYAVAQLLGALSTSLAGEAAGLHKQIIEVLVNALKDPRSKREVVISGQSKGKLEDILYEILLKVTGGREVTRIQGQW